MKFTQTLAPAAALFGAVNAGYPVSPSYPVTYPTETPTYPVETPTYPTETPTSYPTETPTYPTETPTYPVSTPSYSTETVTYPVSTPSYSTETPTYPVSTPSYPVSTPTTRYRLLVTQCQLLRIPLRLPLILRRRQLTLRRLLPTQFTYPTPTTSYPGSSTFVTSPSSSSYPTASTTTPVVIPTAAAAKIGPVGALIAAGVAALVI
ncbi:hypothetical protein F5Y07DRAFT_13098 [Xylaria sp. FL0933]|nr:hypothetical protein F5Y07DRAFT_13098 [Xylaria sp. FL0933]